LNSSKIRRSIEINLDHSEDEETLGASLFTEKHKQEVSNYLHERSAEKVLGRKTDNSKSNNDNENKENDCADF